MSELSPLARIRQAEAEVAPRIAAAQRAAELAVLEAQAQAADLKRQTERDYIKVALDERERSEHFRLKLARQLLGRKLG